MKVIITAGGTTEKIDDVRGITNFSTGRLGSLVAEEFSQVKNIEVIYIHGLGAQLPESENIRSIEVESTRDLSSVLEELLIEEEIDLVVHSMAISDYYGSGIAKPDDVEIFLQSDTPKLLTSFWKIFKSGANKKISSKSDDLVIRLSKNPKVIANIKKWSPTTHLVGFKLLVGVSEQELVKVATETLINNQCDFVLANDKALINGDEHVGLLINQSGIVQRFETKQDIAKGLVKITKEEFLK